MVAYTFRLPDIGEGVAQAEIVAWHVKAGQRIEEDQVMVDVMTDKATVEMTSPVSGTVRVLHGEVGGFVPVGAALVEFDVDDAAGNNAQATVQVMPQATPEAPFAVLPMPQAARPTEPALPEATPTAPITTARTAQGRKLASPATRRAAHQAGVEIERVAGTGPAGRVTPEDLAAYLARPAKPSTTHAAPRLGVSEIKLVGMRRMIAERMQEAKRRIPHFSYVEEFDLTELEALRRELNAEKSPDRPKLTLLPFFMRALVRLLPAFPQVNARYDDEAGVLAVSEGIHIGIATQTTRGLLVPVIRHAETLDLWASARALAEVTASARDGSAAREALTGSTITLTSLGALGGISATPVINRPEVAIIGPNKLVQRPVVLGGQIVIRSMMNVSSSFDHRIVDGYDAASFIQGLKRLIERPALLFVEPSA